MNADIHRNIPDSRGHNAFQVDPDFLKLLQIYAPADALQSSLPEFGRLGALVGDELEQLALQADRHPPSLELRTRHGADLQSVRKHPSYQQLERHAFETFGLAAMSHRGGVFGHSEPLPPIIKYGLTYLFVQAEFGLCCPLSMTDALTRTLRKFGAPELVQRFIGGLTAAQFEHQLQGAMFMTEQDAGSDVGAITTEAREVDGGWRLYGDKWFCSNANADLAMVLARPQSGTGGTGGLSLFLLPRRLPDGSLNNYRIVRLKDKLGTRSMASGEIVLEGAEAWIVGEPGSGFKQMTDMINMSRLSNGVRSAGLMRRGLNEALFICHNREAFGRKLFDLPLMQRQLIKLMVTTEAARSVVFHTAQCLQRADDGDVEAAKLLRILTPLIKFRATRDARKVSGDAMEVRGGCGYIEEWSDARVLRDSHLGSIWEGTSNIVALDVLRATRREGALDYLRDHLHGCINDTGLPEAVTTELGQHIDRVTAAVAIAAKDGNEGQARQLASALYYLCAAIFLAWEAAQLAPDYRRLGLARMLVAHRLAPRDPLSAATEAPELVTQLLLEQPLPLAAVLQLGD